jgi:hypothetical protein
MHANYRISTVAIPPTVHAAGQMALKMQDMTTDCWLLYVTTAHIFEFHNDASDNINQHCWSTSWQSQEQSISLYVRDKA